MLDMTRDMKNLTISGMREQRRLGLAQVAHAPIVLKARDERHRVALFLGEQDAKRRQLSGTLQHLQASGVSVALYPVIDHAERAADWCSDPLLQNDPLKAYLPQTACSETLIQNIGLSQWLGVKVLPAWSPPTGIWCAGIRAPNNCSRYWIILMSLQIRRRPRVDDSHLPATLHPLLRQIFASRGVEDPALLERSASQLLPPQRLYGMEQAVPLLADALTAQKRILIVGDFDCDGATSSALCVLALRAMGGRHIDFLVPNRFEFGYGLTPKLSSWRWPAAPSF